MSKMPRPGSRQIPFRMALFSHLSANLTGPLAGLVVGDRRLHVASPDGLDQADECLLIHAVVVRVMRQPLHAVQRRPQRPSSHRLSPPSLGRLNRGQFPHDGFRLVLVHPDFSDGPRSAQANGW